MYDYVKLGKKTQFEKKSFQPNGILSSSRNHFSFALFYFDVTLPLPVSSGELSIIFGAQYSQRKTCLMPECFKLYLEISTNKRQKNAKSKTVNIFWTRLDGSVKDRI